MHRDDEELVRLAQAGDNAAMERLCVRYKDAVRMMARPYFLIGADRDDLLQEGMIGLYKAIRDYQEGHNASFSSFAEVCVTRQIISAIKASLRQKHQPLNSYISLHHTMGDGENKELMELLGRGEDPEEAFISRETAQHIRKSLQEQLTPLERQAAELFLEGLSYEEIAARLGRGSKSVDNALSRVRKKLSHIARQ